jgi:hypothetical protein
MEVPHTILCLYSKFSVNSKNFLDLMNNNNIDYIIPVCIDNKDMRNRIISSSYQIQYVPCLLFIYGSGSIEKYEGEMAFRWLTEIINNLKKNKEEEVLPKEPEQTPIVIEQPKKKKKVQIEKEESEDEESEEEIPEPPKKVKKNKVVKVSEQTSIDDLIDLGETLKSEQKTPAIKDSGNNNLMSRVQEMQRLRDAEDAKIGKNKPF